MVARSEKRLPELPRSEDSFWTGEVNLTDIKARRAQVACLHSFAKEAAEIKCKKCGMGFFVGAEDRVEDGHFYHKDRLII